MQPTVGRAQQSCSGIVHTLAFLPRSERLKGHYASATLSDLKGPEMAWPCPQPGGGAGGLRVASGPAAHWHRICCMALLGSCHCILHNGGIIFPIRHVLRLHPRVTEEIYVRSVLSEIYPADVNFRLICFDLRPNSCVCPHPRYCILF